MVLIRCFAKRIEYTLECNDIMICSFKQWTKNRGVTETVTCTICLCDIAPSEKVHGLKSCGHVFHAQCLNGWFSAQASGSPQHRRLTCPLCRGTQTLPAGDVEW